MAKWETLDPGVRLWDLIARELRRQRIERGPSMQDMADLLGIDQSTYARYESGETPLPAQRAAKLDEVWRLEGLLENLVGHAKQGKDLNWWETFKEYERQARVIKTYEPSMIPGLLQTEGYARGVFVAGRRQDHEAAIAERLARQKILETATLMAIMDPAALYRQAGTVDAMREQLAHLLEMCDRPNVFIRVVSEKLTVYGGLSASVTVMQTRSGDVGFGRYGLTGVTLVDPADVQEMGVEFDRIGMVSMTTEASRNLIAKTLDGLA